MILTSRVADGVPVRRGVVEETLADLVRELIGKVWTLQLVGEGREAAEANVEHHTQRPDVDGLGVPARLAAGEDLGRHVAGRAAERRCEGRLSDNLGKAEVANLDIQALVHEKDIFGLDIPMHHVAVMLRVRVSAGPLSETEEACSPDT